ncbi:coiled-coil domain-containing protein 25 isoform X2 [Panulirus ornatus]|uniref:coiled-coil domain-containing protein 25 isoform X2 n=1 Tax=Panulirus ornatus TaxID=150431 RepID=UPI003A88878F
MVFYFTSRVVDPPVTLFMGIDKYENEDLIKWGWPEDVWFHVDKVSSAHVYLRLNPGCKMNSIDVVYTQWSNLRKTPGMDVGQVGFHSEKEVRKIRLEKRINEIVNRLNKTKVESHPDFRLEREERDRQERLAAKKELKEKQQKEKEELEKRKKEQELRSYSSLFTVDTMKTNRQAADEDSDDFM